MKQKPVREIAIVLLLALTVRFAYLAWCPVPAPPPDAIADYHPMAVNLLAGKGFINGDGLPDHRRGPGYSLFLAGIYRLAGQQDFPAVRAVQATVDTLTILLAVCLAFRLFQRWKPALFSGMVLAIHPLLVYSSSLILCETIFLFFFTASVLCLVAADQNGKKHLFLLAGLCLALTTLIRSTPILFPVIVGAWLFRRPKISRPVLVVRFGFFLLTFILTVLPWTIRNYLVFREFIPTTSNSGTNFLSGSSLDYLTAEKKRRIIRNKDISQFRKTDAVPWTEMSPARLDRNLWRLGWQNYRETWAGNKTDLARLFFRKTLRFWYATDSGKMQPFLLAVEIPFLLLGAAGFFLILKREPNRRDFSLTGLAVVYFWGVAVFLFPLARYSLPVIPFLAMYISGLIPSPRT